MERILHVYQNHNVFSDLQYQMFTFALVEPGLCLYGEIGNVYKIIPLNINRKIQEYKKISSCIWGCHQIFIYGQTCDMSRSLVGDKLVDHSDVVGASPVTVAPPTS